LFADRRDLPRPHRHLHQGNSGSYPEVLSYFSLSEGEYMELPQALVVHPETFYDEGPEQLHQVDTRYL
jgi:hypothetical protein